MKVLNNNLSATQLKSVWTKIYQDWLDRKVDFTNLTIPSFYNRSKHFAVIVAQGTTMNELVTAIKKRFNVNLYTKDLDALVKINDRIADKDYVVIFNISIEADKNLKNLSADKLAEMNISGITLLERLFLEIFYFDQLGENLDINNWTLCSGSRDYGGVPGVHRNLDGSITVAYFNPSYHSNIISSRAVVTQ
ncbi:MAG: hypothetical protein WCK37_00120 [Candidatus Falkowbacteria bacterium]